MRTGIAAVALAITLPAAAPALASPPPASAFAMLPEMSMVVLSPDGQKVAWANDPGGRPVVMVFDLASGRDLKRLNPTNARVRGLDWADDRTLVISISRSLTQAGSTVAEKRYEFLRFLAIDVTGKGEARSLLMEHPSRELVTGAYLEHLHPGKPGTVVMSTWNFSATARREELGSRVTGGRKDEGYELSLFEVNLANGNGRLIESGSAFTDDWVLDAKGAAVARIDWHPDQSTLTILTKDGNGWKKIYEARQDYELDLVGLSADGRTLLARSTMGLDRFRIWGIPLAGGQFSVIYEDAEHDVTGIVRDRFTGAPAGYAIGGPDPTVHWIDAKIASIQKAVAKSFPDHETTLLDRSQDYQRVVVRTQTAASPPVFYLVDFARGAADIIGEAYPGLADVPLGELQATSYRSRDGLDIPAYLTLPPGREAKALPLVVLPHGGPHARDDTGFDWWTQFLATRGYAVLQPQFRGSWGFGAQLFRAGQRQWGRAMQDDISDGVRHLVERGIADPERVCIMGGSYGGYAALAGAAFTPDLYACAVSVNGLADIPQFLGFVREKSGDDSASYRYWRDMVGEPSDDDVARFSPARAIDAIRTPILLVHGTSDTVVPFSQSANFARLLAQHGKHHELLRLEGEDHWLSTGAARLQLLQAVEPFLASHLQTR